MEIDTTIKIHLRDGFTICDVCNYQTLLMSINDECEFLISPDNIIPKTNIDFIETIKKEGEDDLSTK